MVEKKWVWIIDVAIPGDGRIEEKELESKYQDLKIEIERLWEKLASVVPVVIRSLGAIPRDLRKHLRMLSLESISPSQLQKTSPTGNSTYPMQVPLKFLDP